MENLPPQNPENKNLQINKQTQRPKKKKKDFINNSGQGDVPVVKVVSDKFNWGAFLLNWVWGVHYKKYITLLIIPACFIPLLPIGLCIWFGIKGNTWAWQSKRYKSIKEFHEIQKKWALWATILSIVGIISSIVIWIITFGLLFNFAMTPSDIQNIQNMYNF